MRSNVRRANATEGRLANMRANSKSTVWTIGTPLVIVGAGLLISVVEAAQHFGAGVIAIRIFCHLSEKTLGRCTLDLGTGGFTVSGEKLAACPKIAAPIDPKHRVDSSAFRHRKSQAGRTRRVLTCERRYLASFYKCRVAFIRSCRLQIISIMFPQRSLSWLKPQFRADWSILSDKHILHQMSVKAERFRSSSMRVRRMWL